MELYVTDLDGTLLNSDKKISSYSINILNSLIDKGINFTVATARTPATVVEILEGINLKLPVTLMNGVLIYDIKEQKYIDVKELEENIVEKVLDVFEKCNKAPLVYGIKDNHLWVYYKEFKYSYEYNFYKERANKKLKTFLKVLDYKKVIENSKIINFIAFDNYNKIKEIADGLAYIEGITINYYKDIYEEDCYYLEVYSNKASKANGIKYLLQSDSYNKVICFGDNVNDIPMFQVADESYVPINATKEIKSISTAVIGSCEENGVANFLKNKFG